ncbi:hypothetical protein GS400_16915 [Pontibacillus sp. HMF3514]|nr:hypothetical protein GS400_16915 [Pontibacillus sp. HMF3514]
MATASSHNHNIYPSWSPDGNFISFHSDNVDDPSTSGDIWTVEVSSGTSGANHMEGNMLKLHVGANSKQNFDVILTDARTSALGLNKVNVLNNKQAGESLNIIDQAIQTISSERSKYGAYQNAFEHINNNLQNYNEQLTTSESRIRDVDMAKEMMKQTKNSILSQASQAIFAQANQTSQGVVQLLR